MKREERKKIEGLAKKIGWLFGILIICITFLILSVVIRPSTEPQLIEAEEIKDYVGTTVKLEITPITQLEDKAVPASLNFLLVRHYYVYETQEKIEVLILKPQTLSLREKVTLTGVIREADGKYTLFVDTIEQVQ